MTAYLGLLFSVMAILWKIIVGTDTTENAITFWGLAVICNCYWAAHLARR